MKLQLEKLVNYHRALADPTRIKMLILLANGELNGLELAERLGVTPATVTHHAGKLRKASLIRERREKNNIYFALNSAFLQSGAEATVHVISNAAHEGVKELTTEKNEALKASVLKNFFQADGRLKIIPAQLKKKLIVLEHLVSKLEMGRKYSEKDINEFIKQFHEDFATIRREFIMHGYMYRENQVYELNPREMWTKWEQLK